MYVHICLKIYKSTSRRDIQYFNMHNANVDLWVSSITEGRNFFSIVHFCNIYQKNYIYPRAACPGWSCQRRNGCSSIETPCPEMTSAMVTRGVSARSPRWSGTFPDDLRDPSWDLKDEKAVFRRVLTCHDDETPEICPDNRCWLVQTGHVTSSLASHWTGMSPCCLGSLTSCRDTCCCSLCRCNPRHATSRTNHPKYICCCFYWIHWALSCCCSGFDALFCLTSRALAFLCWPPWGRCWPWCSWPR